METSADQSERQMTPAAKVMYLLALIIGLSFGAVFGFWNTGLILKSYYSTRRSIAPKALYDFSIVQYRYADAEHARTALLSFAGFSEKLEAPTPYEVEQLELFNTYARLALLEDSENNARASQGYMAKARYWCTATGRHCPSDSEMKAAVKDRDELLQRLGFQ